MKLVIYSILFLVPPPPISPARTRLRRRAGGSRAVVCRGPTVLRSVVRGCGTSLRSAGVRGSGLRRPGRRGSASCAFAADCRASTHRDSFRFLIKLTSAPPNQVRKPTGGAFFSYGKRTKSIRHLRRHDSQRAPRQCRRFVQDPGNARCNSGGGPEASGPRPDRGSDKIPNGKTARSSYGKCAQ